MGSSRPALPLALPLVSLERATGMQPEGTPSSENVEPKQRFVKPGDDGEVVGARKALDEYAKTPGGIATLRQMRSLSHGTPKVSHGRQKVTDGLIVKGSWLDWVFEQGAKQALLIADESTDIRGPIALLQSKAGVIAGTAHLVDCIGPLDVEAFEALQAKHEIRLKTAKGNLPHRETYAYVVEDSRQRPFEFYAHPGGGAVKWVPLSGGTEPVSFSPPGRTVEFSRGQTKSITSGAQQASIRVYREDAHQFDRGELFVGDFRDGARLVLRATQPTEVCKLKQVTDRIMLAAGYETRKEMMEALQKHYPDLTEASEVGVLHFEMLTPKT
ncbi:MAG: ASCH domain-containing protein [Myxococcota bacterium]